MTVHPLNKYSQTALDQMLMALPFYRAVKNRDQYQFDLLMGHSQITEYRPNEVVLQKGQKDKWLYFLVKGQLMVMVGENSTQPNVVNYITPGEVFGDLAILNDHERTATVRADPNSKSILVFGTNFSVFGELRDLSKISLQTKLEYFRNMTHNLRWKLEVYRLNYPDKPHALKHRKVKIYTGQKNTLDELTSLHAQCKELAQLLMEWNTEFESINVMQPNTSFQNKVVPFGQ